MRILFADHETRLSGGQRDLVDLVRGLAPLGHDINVALPGPGPLADALTLHGAAVHFVSMDDALLKVSRWDLARRPWRAASRMWAALAVVVRLTRLARRLQPDVIHTNTMKTHVLATPAAWATGAPLVWHIRDILSDGWLRSAFARIAGVVARRIVCLSEVAAEPFRKGRARGRTRVVYNGIRPAPVAAADIEDMRRRLGADPDDVLIGIVGQIAAWKGQDVFVDAAALLADEHPGVRFAVVGECLFPENEGGYEAATRASASSGSLAGRLSWAGPIEPIEPVMAACDVLVHASRLPEPFGRVIVEAMAQGTPVISTDIGSGPELILPEVGILVPPGDPAALAAALSSLLDDRTRRDAMGARARIHAQRFGIEATAAGVVSVYGELGLVG